MFYLLFDFSTLKRHFEEGTTSSDNSHDNSSSGGIWERMQSAYVAVRSWWRNAGELMPEGDELERVSIFEGNVLGFSRKNSPVEDTNAKFQGVD